MPCAVTRGVAEVDGALTVPESAACPPTAPVPPCGKIASTVTTTSPVFTGFHPTCQIPLPMCVSFCAVSPSEKFAWTRSALSSSRPHQVSAPNGHLHFQRSGLPRHRREVLRRRPVLHLQVLRSASRRRTRQIDVIPAPVLRVHSVSRRPRRRDNKQHIDRLRRRLIRKLKRDRPFGNASRRQRTEVRIHPHRRRLIRLNASVGR